MIEIRSHQISKSVGYTSSESRAVSALLHANTKSFNLSASEVESFQELGRQFPEKEPSADATAAVNRLIRNILQERLTAYRKGGTKAVEPYLTKGGAERHPAMMLDEAASDSILSKEFPDFHRALVAYPEFELNSSFYWIKLRPMASSFPCFALGHRMQSSGTGLRLFVSRLFYIGSGLEAVHTNMALLPFGNDVILLSAVRAMGTALIGLNGAIWRRQVLTALKDDARHTAVALRRREANSDEYVERKCR